MQSKNRANKVEFDEPDYVLLIHVICNMCFLSFVPKYFEFRKYNLVEMGCKFNAASAKPAVADVSLAKNESIASANNVVDEQNSSEPESSGDDDDGDDDDNDEGPGVGEHEKETDKIETGEKQVDDKAIQKEKNEDDKQLN